MKAYGGVDVQIHLFLTSALVEGEGSALPPRRGKEPLDRRLIGVWVGRRTDLDDMEKRKFLSPPGLELRPPRSSSP
jgi:hypothetical protein